ncbi:MarR family transcriptional regulator [Sinomonas sp. ASV486]|uniref:MarR family winged helix-turn-helix transcriptional regulator n=1 Tax=Sinomonas sp. ASV486 TaxID=3051170 RepID=UPI0027DBF566|nr:MarR family transcriptional regulator [Sinomonas sp. ASV486]MDQ4491911.1 MarR family transcriptional regulator [Sinomonas sp. ASV486]
MPDSPQQDVPLGDKRGRVRIGFLLSQLGAHATELFADQTRGLGISPSEAGVIRIIGRSPGISQRELAGRLGSVQSRVVALIDRLEGAGLVTRTRSSADRRVQELRLTESGTSVLRSLRHSAEAQEAAIVEGLTAEQTAELFGLLVKLSSLRGLDTEVHVGYRAP